jgi:hypothetical protein
MLYKFLSNNEHHNIVQSLYLQYLFIFQVTLITDSPTRQKSGSKQSSVAMIVLFKQLIEVIRLSFQLPIHIHV